MLIIPGDFPATPKSNLVGMSIKTSPIRQIGSNHD